MFLKKKLSELTGKLKKKYVKIVIALINIVVSSKNKKNK
jgi:hypothetical protein